MDDKLIRKCSNLNIQDDDTWTLPGKVIIRVIDVNRFVFQFFHWRDKEKVMEGRPWCFDQQLLILESITDNEKTSQVALNHSPFWIRVYNLPFNCRSNVALQTLTGGMGSIMEIEPDEFELDKFRRIRILLDVRKPLRRSQRIKNKDGSVVTIDFKYERLPFFCFACGVMGHSEKECSKEEEDGKEKNLEWGLWLKASPRKGRMRNLEEVNYLKSCKKISFVGRKASHPDTGASRSSGASKENDMACRGLLEDEASSFDNEKTRNMSGNIGTLPNNDVSGNKNCFRVH
ncbi:hypothetical protein RDABS01_027658 [Bienertia sinuspersici]